MQTWINFKSPPAHGWIFMLLIIGLYLILPTRPEDDNKNSTFDLSGIRGRRELTDSSKPNVTCIAHDAKFTCDCRNVHQRMTLPHLVGYVYQVEISNCRALTIDASALEETQGLRKLTFKNIDNLVLNRNALAFPRSASNTPLIIEFEKVNFEIIDSHAINGNIEEISFIGGRIDIINPFGFTTLKDHAILLKMDNVLIKKIEPQAFKKFSVEQMEITNCIFESNLPSKAFYELEVLNTLRINNVQFKEVHSRVFSFKLINKLSITNNTFLGIDSEWMEAHIRESAVIRDNYFGATRQLSFKGITVHRDYMLSEKLELRFINNTVVFPNDATPRPLEFSERFRLNIEDLHYENEFSCRDLDTNFKPPRPRIEFFQTYADKVLFKRSANNDVHQSYLVLSKTIELDCKPQSYLLYILLAVLVLVIILIAIAVIVWLVIAKKNKRRKMDMVLPEPRTYKETQIVYQIENAGLLKTDL